MFISVWLFNITPEWVTPLVTGSIVLLGWAINYGTFTQKIADTRRDVQELKANFNQHTFSCPQLATAKEEVKEVKTDLAKHKADIWPKVNALDAKVENIRGRLGMNGEPHGKSHHVT